MKDPGFSPSMIVDQAHRSGRYSQVEIDSLVFDETAPSAIDLAKRWKVLLLEAEKVLDILPADHVGDCALDRNGNLIRANSEALEQLINAHKITWRSGSLRGAYPNIKTG